MSRFKRYNDKVETYTFRLNKEDLQNDEVRLFLNEKKKNKELSCYLLNLILGDMKKRES